MGSIRKRGNRYQAQVRRQGQRSIGKSFIFRQDAKRWIREVEAKIDRGEYEGLQPAALTLHQLLERYKRDITPHKKGHEAETRRLNRLMKDSLAETPLSTLSGQQLASFRDRRVKDGKRACQYDLVLIRHAVEIGRKEWGLALPSNPVDLIRIPNGIKRRERRLEGDEWQRLKMASAVCTNPYTWPAVQLALYTAMRRSELLKLTWKDVDTESRIAYLQDTKNGQPRAVPLTHGGIDEAQNRAVCSVETSQDGANLKFYHVMPDNWGSLELTIDDGFFDNIFSNNDRWFLRDINDETIIRIETEDQA